MIFDRWLTLGATTGLELLAGLGFAFSLYAPTLKETLHLSQPQLQGLGTAMLCGGLFGVLPGLVYDKLFDWPKLAPRYVHQFGFETEATVRKWWIGLNFSRAWSPYMWVPCLLDAICMWPWMLLPSRPSYLHRSKSLIGCMELCMYLASMNDHSWASGRIYINVW